MSALFDAILELDLCVPRADLIAQAGRGVLAEGHHAGDGIAQGALDLKDALLSVRKHMSAVQSETKAATADRQAGEKVEPAAKDLVGDLEGPIADAVQMMMVCVRLFESEMTIQHVDGARQCVLAGWQIELLNFSTIHAQKLVEIIQDRWEEANDKAWGRAA